MTRFKMRLALAMGRTVRELEESLTADEWADWLVFHASYDLPDNFLTTGQIGSFISKVLGGNRQPFHFAPYYQADPAARSNASIKEYFAFAKEYVNSKRKSGRTQAGR